MPSEWCGGEPADRAAIPTWLVLWITGACAVMVASVTISVWAFRYGLARSGVVMLVAGMLSGAAMLAGIGLIPDHDEQEVTS